MRACTRSVVLTLLALGFAAPAAAQTQLEWWCSGRNNASAILRMGGCNALIQSGKLKGPKLAKAYVLRGKAFLMERDMDHAMADYDQAIRLDPENAPAYVARGFAFVIKKASVRALRDLAKAIELAPNDARAWAYQAAAYRLIDKDDQALASFAEAIKRAPDWMSPYNDRGELYLEAHDYDLAIRDFDQTVRLSKTYAIGWSNRCRAYAIVGKLKAALGDCNAALKIDPRFINNMTKSGLVSAIQNRGLVHLKAGEFDLAIKDYKEAFNLLPNSAEVLFGRGIARQKYGDEAGAFPDISRAKSLDPIIAEKFAALGVK